jgi:hypothetical protein
LRYQLGERICGCLSFSLHLKSHDQRLSDRVNKLSCYKDGEDLKELSKHQDDLVFLLADFVVNEYSGGQGRPVKDVCVNKNSTPARAEGRVYSVKYDEEHSVSHFENLHVINDVLALVCSDFVAFLV